MVIHVQELRNMFLKCISWTRYSEPGVFSSLLECVLVGWAVK